MQSETIMVGQACSVNLPLLFAVALWYRQCEFKGLVYKYWFNPIVFVLLSHLL